MQSGLDKAILKRMWDLVAGNSGAGCAAIEVALLCSGLGKTTDASQLHPLTCCPQQFHSFNIKCTLADAGFECAGCTELLLNCKREACAPKGHQRSGLLDDQQ
jgi:hypothetical protein